MINSEIDPAFRSIMEIFRAHGFGIKLFSSESALNGFRVEPDDGCHVDIYLLPSHSDHALARIQPSGNDTDEINSEVLRISRMLYEKLGRIAVVSAFKPSKNTSDKHSFHARINMTDTPDFHETVRMEERRDDLEPQNLKGLAEEALSLLETVDAGTLRNALDKLDLSRTGNVRIALTRIYRSAIDAEEMNAAIEKEGEKITRQSEIDELERIRELPSADFLSPMIELLWRAAHKANTPPYTD